MTFHPGAGGHGQDYAECMRSSLDQRKKEPREKKITATEASPAARIIAE